MGIRAPRFGMELGGTSPHLPDDLPEPANLFAVERQVTIAPVFFEHRNPADRFCSFLGPSSRYILAVARFVPETGLHQLYSHADLFVLPSYHEGLPIALLAAMSYGLSVLVSDVPANKEVELPAHRYFRCGNVKDLGEKMASLLERQMTVQEKEALRARIAADYDWRRIAGQTVAVYERVLGGSIEGAWAGSEK